MPETASNDTGHQIPRRDVSILSLADDRLRFVRMQMICTIQVTSGALWLLPSLRKAVNWRSPLYSVAPSAQLTLQFRLALTFPHCSSLTPFAD